MLKEFWAIYWKRVIGVATGLFFGMIYLFFGFWDMLFVGLLVYVGYWIGKHKELDNGPILPWQRLWNALTDRFRPFR